MNFVSATAIVRELHVTGSRAAGSLLLRQCRHGTILLVVECREWTNHERFANLEETRLSVFRYIEMFYNPVRLHENLNYCSADAYEAEHAPAAAA